MIYRNAEERLIHVDEMLRQHHLIADKVLTDSQFKAVALAAENLTLIDDGTVRIAIAGLQSHCDFWMNAIAKEVRGKRLRRIKNEINQNAAKKVKLYRSFWENKEPIVLVNNKEPGLIKAHIFWDFEDGDPSVLEMVTLK